MHLAIALVTAVIFLIDLQLPLGVAVSQLYVIPVLLALWSPIPRLPFIIAAIGTTLSIVDLPLSPVGGHWFGLISKPLSWLIIWITAILVFRHGQLARKVRNQDTLARVGEMAAVLAHEVRNPLTGLHNGLEIVARRLPADSRDREAVRAMQARIDALNELMRDVLRFAHDQPIRLAIVPIPSLLAGVATALRSEFPTIDLDVKADERLAGVPGDIEQLQLAFGHILRNAAQAMDGCGRVTLTTQACDRLCTVRVQDEGPGLPIEMRGRVFEPFATTKSRGTGLGLAITRKIIEAHQGRITVACPAAGGTLVTVSLPREIPRSLLAASPD